MVFPFFAPRFSLRLLIPMCAFTLIHQIFFYTPVSFFPNQHLCFFWFRQCVTPAITWFFENSGLFGCNPFFFFFLFGTVVSFAYGKARILRRHVYHCEALFPTDILVLTRMSPPVPLPLDVHEFSCFCVG